MSRDASTRRSRNRLSRFQKRAMKLVSDIQYWQYQERLRIIHLFYLYHCCHRRNMIIVYQTLRQGYNMEADKFSNTMIISTHRYQ